MTTDPTTPRRRFQLVDGMILVAATAVGLVGIQQLAKLTNDDIAWASLVENWESICEQGVVHRIDKVAESTLIFLIMLMPLVMSWTLALICIRFIGPRPRFRHLTRQPGLVATTTSVLATAFIALGVLFRFLGSGLSWDPFLGNALVMWVIVPLTSIGIAILAPWSTLLVGHRWRSEASWIDRLGRAAGIFWIVAGFMTPGLFAIAQWF